MTSFKIFIKKNSNSVFLKGKFEDYTNYSDLQQKIIKQTLTSSFKANKEMIKKSDLYKLEFGAKEDNSYIHSELSEGIFDEESFHFFKNQLNAKGIKNGKYKLYIEKVDSLPKFKKKERDEILGESLKQFWNLTLEDITSELNLKKLEESKMKFDKMKQEQKKNEEILQNITHNGIICSNCFKKDFTGKRFICAECDNYNLCQECEKFLNEKEIHQREHVLIQINKSLNDDNLNYNNIIGKYQKEFQNVDKSFKFEFTVVNNGENDLQNCYILPVRYGETYLTCDAQKITESIQKGKNSKISLNVKLQQNIGYFEGYFRMFTPNGLPFGNIINIKVMNGN